LPKKNVLIRGAPFFPLLSAACTLQWNAEMGGEMRGEMRGSLKSYVIVLIIIAVLGLGYVLIFGFHSSFFVKSLAIP
jgi:hypothetical protein